MGFWCAGGAAKEQCDPGKSTSTGAQAESECVRATPVTHRRRVLCRKCARRDLVAQGKTVRYAVRY